MEIGQPSPIARSQAPAWEPTARAVLSGIVFFILSSIPVQDEIFRYQMRARCPRSQERAHKKWRISSSTGIYCW